MKKRERLKKKLERKREGGEEIERSLQIADESKKTTNISKTI